MKSLSVAWAMTLMLVSAADVPAEYKPGEAPANGDGLSF